MSLISLSVSSGPVSSPGLSVSTGVQDIPAGLTTLPFPVTGQALLLSQTASAGLYNNGFAEENVEAGIFRVPDPGRWLMKVKVVGQLYSNQPEVPTAYSVITVDVIKDGTVIYRALNPTVGPREANDGFHWSFSTEFFASLALFEGQRLRLVINRQVILQPGLISGMRVLEDSRLSLELVSPLRLMVLGLRSNLGLPTVNLVPYIRLFKRI